MTVYVVIREDQNKHGYVDTSITGVFQDEGGARQHEEEERRRAAVNGLIVVTDGWDVVIDGQARGVRLPPGVASSS